MALQSTPSAHDAAHAPQSPPVVLNGRLLEGNRRIPLNLDWVDEVRVNTSAVERRAATHVARRTVKKENQAAWLLRAIACMDLTTLSGDDSADRVRRLCAKARNPLQRIWLKASASRSCISPSAPSASITPLLKRRSKRSRDPAFPSLPSPPDFPPAFRRWPSASRRFSAPSKPARRKSTLSSRARTSSTANGRRSTTKSPLSNRPAVPRT